MKFLKKFFKSNDTGYKSTLRKMDPKNWIENNIIFKPLIDMGLELSIDTDTHNVYIGVTGYRNLKHYYDQKILTYRNQVLSDMIAPTLDRIVGDIQSTGHHCSVKYNEISSTITIYDKLILRRKKEYHQTVRTNENIDVVDWIKSNEDVFLDLIDKGASLNKVTSLQKSPAYKSKYAHVCVEFVSCDVPVNLVSNIQNRLESMMDIQGIISLQGRNIVRFLIPIKNEDTRIDTRTIEQKTRDFHLWINHAPITKKLLRNRILPKVGYDSYTGDYSLIFYNINTEDYNNLISYINSNIPSGIKKQMKYVESEMKCYIYIKDHRFLFTK